MKLKNKRFLFHRKIGGFKLICKDILLLIKKTQKTKEEKVRFIFFRRNPRLFRTPNFQRVLPWCSFLRDVIILAVIIFLAFYAFINPSFLFFLIWDSCLPHGVNYTFLKYQHGRAENSHKEKHTHKQDCS